MYLDKEEKAKLIGRTVVGVDCKDGGEDFVLIFTDGSAKFRTSGDCCSHTWIEHCEYPEFGKRGSKLTAIESVDKGSEQSDEHDCLAFYETRFTTPKGDIVVEYRNSSNGYYGGSLDLISVD